MGWEHVRNCFPVPNEVFQLGLSANEIAVYAYLLRCADRRTGQCHPSMQTIAETLRLARNTVAKYIRSLEEQGLTAS